MAQAGNVLFLYRNLLDEAALTASSQATPVDRLKDMRPTRLWMTAGCAAEWLLIDNGQSETMTHGALVAYNNDVEGTFRCRVSDDPLFPINPGAAEVLYDDTVESWSPVAGLGDDGFGMSGGGYPILTGINDYRPYRVFDYGGPLTARYTRFDIVNPTLPAGQVQIGRAFTGLGVQPERNFAWDWNWEWVDPSEITETEESVFINRRKKYRVLRFTLPGLRRGEAIQAFDDLKRIVGTSRDLMVVLYPQGDTPMQYRTTVYGLSIETSGISNPHLNRFSTTFAVRELAR